MRIKITVFLFVLVLGLPLAASAQNSDSAKRADILRLLRMTGASKGATQSVDLMLPSLRQAMPQVPEQVWTECRGEVREQDMTDLTYAIWDKHFTHQEIRELIRFYQTPVGQKIIRDTPLIQQESLAAGQKWGAVILDRILLRLKEKGYRLPPSLEQ